jgi:nucleotide-binding universal stress UspA family protein
MAESLNSGGFQRFTVFRTGAVIALVNDARHARRAINGGLELKRLSRVLVAVAIDDRDRHVFAHALALARRHDAKLLLLHATSPEVSLNRGATERVEFLRQLRSLADAAGVEIRVAVQTGPVHEIILLHARARKVDLIVMGNTPNERRRGLSGWIAERVLRDASCPTLVVPQGSEPAALDVANILVAVDFAPASQAAIREAVQLSKPRKQPLTLLHVVDAAGSRQHVHSASLATNEFHRGLAADALTRLQALIPQPNQGVAVARVAVGRPVTEILRAARKMKAQLIVIGAKPRTRIGSRLFGKTGQLLRDATCPVLAVPVAAVANHATEDVRKEAA